MHSKSPHFLKKLISWFLNITILGAMIVAFIPAASAVAATSIVTSATFNNAGTVALADNILVTFTEPVCGEGLAPDRGRQSDNPIRGMES